MMHPDDRDFTYTSDAEWDRAEAREIGREHPERAWVLTDRDVWHANPFYQGKAVPHPEDDRSWNEIEAEQGPTEDRPLAAAVALEGRKYDDDIPF